MTVSKYVLQHYRYLKLVIIIEGYTTSKQAIKTSKNRNIKIWYTKKSHKIFTQNKYIYILSLSGTFFR